MSTQRECDVVIFGATGFVGRLVAQYCAEHFGGKLRVGLAGRSATKLEALQASLPGAADWPVIVADSFDAPALDAMVKRTRVVATTVGPYAKYGRELVAACARRGTHYADLTGESLFAADCVKQLHHTAHGTGAIIVNSCGFDSIPSDLGVLVAHQAASDAGAGHLTDVTLAVRAMKGGISGGTIDSFRHQVDTVKSNPSLRRLLSDPYSLLPPDVERPRVRQPRDLAGVSYRDSLRSWVGPFVMASHNTRVVHRSNALLDFAYGSDMRYQEVVAFGRSGRARLQAQGMQWGLRALMMGMATPGTRQIFDRVLPDPGDGPSEQSRDEGHFALEVVAFTSGGPIVRVKVTAQGDPGYAATSVMLAESARTLALSPGGPGGVLTPATAMGSLLVDRLREAGMTITASAD